MEKIFAKIIDELYGVVATPIVTRPEPQFGDIATNVALQLAKQVGKNPREIAEQIAEKLRKSGKYDKVEVAGPGFINITLGSEALLGAIREEPRPVNAGRNIVL